MTETTYVSAKRKPWTVASLFCLAMLACAVHFVSDYDEVTDRTITDLHARVEAFLPRMADAAGTPAGIYDSNKVFYTDVEAALEAMMSRAVVTPQNQSTVDQLKKLEENIKLLAQLHKAGGEKGLNPDAAGSVRDILNVQFRAIIKHQLDLKRGK